MVNDSDYATGFEQGFRAIRGASAHLPHLPHLGHVKHGRTAFQMGLMRGVERAKGWDYGDLIEKETLT